MKTDSSQMPPQGNITIVNGMQMYYEVYGEGSPLVLLHGFTQSTVFWQPYNADFAKHFKLIVADLRGHGRSTNPTNQFTHRQSALDIFALLDQLEINQFKAIGLSTGGETLLHMATQKPTRVEAMVLISAASYWPEEQRDFFRQLKAEEWMDYMRKHHVYGDEQIRALLDQLHNFKDSYDDMNFTPPYLSTITAKTLIVNGDRDPLVPISIPAEMYASIPNAYLWIVPNGGHVPITDARAEPFTQTALDFLQDNWD